MGLKIDGRSTTPPPNSRPARTNGILGLVVVAVLIVAGISVWSLTRPTPSVPSVYHPEVRQYFVAADPIVWNYTPSGTNELTGVPLGSTTKDLYVAPGPEHPATYLNGTYPMETFLKCAYEQYTDGSFGTLVSRPASEAYLGLAGPLIYAAVGDTIRIEFRNNCPFATNLSAPGLTAGADHPGSNSSRSSNGSGGPVAPGGTWNYTWPVLASAGPPAGGPASTMWMYTDGVAPLNGTDTGLFGAVVVSSDSVAGPDGIPDDVAANFVLLLGAMNETESPYFAYNLAHYVPDLYALHVSGVRYAINGYNFGNLPMITVTQGEHVRWYVGDVGASTVVPAWTGNTLVEGGVNIAAAGVAPGSTTALDMWANNSGVWLVDSADPSDLAGGMEARYTVLPSIASAPDATLAVPVDSVFIAVPAAIRAMP
jgi:hypothetical protein